MTRSVSIQDIARAAGVSHTTVSRALRNSSLISKDVRENIRRLADEMGYTPNALAQSLRGARTNSVGLVVTTIADPFVGQVVRGIEDVAHREEISIFLSVSYNDPEREMAVIENFHRRRVDGILLVAAKISPQYESRLARTNVPIVVINQQAEGQFELLHSVATDDYSGARQAVAHLMALGHEKIGYLGAGNRPRSNRLRLQAYRDELEAHGLCYDERRVRIAPAMHQFHTDDINDGAAMLPDLLAAGITAVFCYNDMIAIGALQACHAAGLCVPGDISIAGYDDIELSPLVTPALTTVHQPKLSLGTLGMDMLLDLMASRPVQDHLLPVELVPRVSTACLQKGMQFAA